jgi:hypothetical protein
MDTQAPAVEPPLGSVGLTTIHGDVGWLIRLGQWLARVTWKFWTWRTLWKTAQNEHAVIYIGGGKIIEAESGPAGARLADLSEYDDRPVLWLHCPDQYGPAVAHSARLLQGTRYSAADYFALAAHRFHLPVPGLRAFIEASGHAMCSQLADMAAQLGGWQIFGDGRWRGYVMPFDLAELALTQAQ